MAQKIETAQVANQTFFQRMSAEQYDVIYFESTSEFKASANRDDVVAQLRRVRQKSGACDTPTVALTSYHLTGSVDFTYRRKCPHGEIDERFSWNIVNGQALLKEYIVNGPGL